MSEIQLISHRYHALFADNQKLKLSSLQNPSSFDDYDINIIDLNDDSMWTKEFNIFNNIYNDIKNIRKMIQNNNKSIVIIIYPQNIVIKDYHSEAKNCINTIDATIYKLCGLSDYRYHSVDILLHGDPDMRHMHQSEFGHYQESLFPQDHPAAFGNDQRSDQLFHLLSDHPAVLHHLRRRHLMAHRVCAAVCPDRRRLRAWHRHDRRCVRCVCPGPGIYRQLPASAGVLRNPDCI